MSTLSYKGREVFCSLLLEEKFGNCNDLKDDLPTLVVPGVQLAAAPARDELLHAVTVQVEGEDRRGLVLGLDPPPPRRLLVHAHRAVSQGVPEPALL